MDILNSSRWRCSPEIEQFTKNCIQTYAATEVGYISRGLNGEPELLELVNPKNIEIYKKIAKAMAIAEKVQEETGVELVHLLPRLLDTCLCGASSSFIQRVAI